MSNCDDIRLFCNGYYAEILVMDPFSLEIIFSLSSKVKPDWISALHVSYRLQNAVTPTPLLIRIIQFAGFAAIKAQG